MTNDHIRRVSEVFNRKAWCQRAGVSPWTVQNAIRNDSKSYDPEWRRQLTHTLWRDVRELEDLVRTGLQAYEALDRVNEFMPLAPLARQAKIPASTIRSSKYYKRGGNPDETTPGDEWRERLAEEVHKALSDLVDVLNEIQADADYQDLLPEPYVLRDLPQDGPESESDAEHEKRPSPVEVLRSVFGESAGGHNNPLNTQEKKKNIRTDGSPAHVLMSVFGQRKD